MQERRGAETVLAARHWLNAQAGAQTFLWVHVYDPHFPYDPPEPFASRFAGDPYHGEVAATDEALRPLLEPLLQAGRQSRTLVRQPYYAYAQSVLHGGAGAAVSDSAHRMGRKHNVCDAKGNPE